MTQQYPGPQNPGQQWGPQPTPPKKSRGKTLGFGCLGFIVVFIIIAVAANAGKSTSSSSDASSSSVKQSQPSSAASDSSSGDSSNSGSSNDGTSDASSDIDKFKNCVSSSGTAEEKSAVTHVTKLQGNAMGADVYTDYSGGMMGPDQGNGKLIASAYASCTKSDTGSDLVTVYDKDGQILSNGNF
jgi:hypothetical protein